MNSVVRKIVFKNLFLSILFIVWGCALLHNNNRNTNHINDEIEEYVNNYRSSHENFFIGIGRAHHVSDKCEAEKIACLLAKGDLATSIKQEIFSVSERIVVEIKYKNKTEIIKKFKNTIKALSDVQLPYSVKPKVHKYWENENGHNFLAIAEIDREEYADYLLTKIHDVDILEMFNDFRGSLIKNEK